MSNFDKAFERIIGHEGGYVSNPKDPGGETKYGISKRAYPNENIKTLTLARAKKIYKRDYWDKVQGDRWPYVVAENLFDSAVNSGVKQAIIWLQRAVYATEDGIIGPKTRAAVDANKGSVVAARMCGHRLDFLNNLKTWPTFGKGWSQRIAEQLIAFPAS